jgi:hypothetical protein
MIVLLHRLTLAPFPCTRSLDIYFGSPERDWINYSRGTKTRYYSVCLLGELGVCLFCEELFYFRRVRQLDFAKPAYANVS